MSKRLKTLVKDGVDIVDDDVTKKSGRDNYSEIFEMVRCSRQIVFEMRNYFNDNVACEDLMALFQNGVKVFSLPPCLQREKYALFYIALDKRQCTELFLSSVNWKKFRRSVRRFEISLRWLSKRDV